MTTTIQDVIDTILGRIPGGRLDETVDTVKCGDPTQTVTGIVTTFLASYDVIEEAVKLGANFIITHEPTFYNHLDDVAEFEGHAVYEAKRRLLDENQIVVWRFHDHWHRHVPDGISTGVVRALGWEAYADAGDGPVFSIPATTVGELAAGVKAKLGIDTVRIVGDLEMPCRNVALMVGAPGGHWQTGILNREGVEVLLTGEIHEWETSEYVRDAVAQGRKKALIVLGHVQSEEPGMAYLVEWLHPLVPAVPITHVPVGSAFTYV
ncbi:MAG: Nif3-like dinuclear metal center hexameric protein [Anaerolineae bacterium]|nr:Nif3-like dinuclear metal center hexameric protein [Anaerolineae bacterium]